MLLIPEVLFRNKWRARTEREPAAPGSRGNDRDGGG